MPGHREVRTPGVAVGSHWAKESGKLLAGQRIRDHVCFPGDVCDQDVEVMGSSG